MIKKILLGIIVLAVVFMYFKPENPVEITENQTLSIETNKNEPSNENPEPPPVLNKIKPSTDSIKNNKLGQTRFIEDIDSEKLFQSINSSESNVNYIKIDESGLPPFEIENLKKDYDNLNRYGSYSGGVITNEFTKSDDFAKALERNGGIENILNKLNFIPTDVGGLLGNNFKLVGADYAGAINKGKFNSIFRYYESNDKRKLEVNEMYLNPENNYSIDIYQESINFYLSGIPATIQSLKNNENQEIYNLDFTVKNRVFSVSSEGIGYSDFLKINSEIINNINESK